VETVSFVARSVLVDFFDNNFGARTVRTVASDEMGEVFHIDKPSNKSVGIREVSNFEHHSYLGSTGPGFASQDARANDHCIPLEVDKAQRDQGHHIHPELFGHEGEPSIAKMHHPRPPAPAQK
jgi:hypothetical protein